MIALDTNVLVRFLVEDDEQQTTQAKQLIANIIITNGSIFLSDIVVAETIWVLGRSYRFGRKEIASVLNRLLIARHVVFSSSDEITKALDAFENGKADFADYLIREQARKTGCKQIATFDRKLLTEDDFATAEMIASTIMPTQNC